MPGRTDFVRFGLFELDLAQGLLTKEGRLIKLQEQPFRVLSILLERPGQTVTREQFRQALWTADTFVDFDRGLNAAIAKLRQGLGDSADNPRFIETQARRGYRFIAPVDVAALPVPSPAVQEPPTPRFKIYSRFRFAALLVMAIGAGVLYDQTHRERGTPSPETLPSPVPLTNRYGVSVGAHLFARGFSRRFCLARARQTSIENLCEAHRLQRAGTTKHG